MEILLFMFYAEKKLIPCRHHSAFAFADSNGDLVKR
jgi:hypothetical protein